MSQINNIVMEGNLTADGDLRHFGEKGIELSFTIANNSGFGDYAKTTFIKCKLFGKRAESLVRYLHKGSKVTVQGNLFIDSYDKEGEKKYFTYIKVWELSLGPKSSAGSQSDETTDDDEDTKNDGIPF